THCQSRSRPLLWQWVLSPLSCSYEEVQARPFGHLSCATRGRAGGAEIAILKVCERWLVGDVIALFGGRTRRVSEGAAASLVRIGIRPGARAGAAGGKRVTATARSHAMCGTLH